MKKYILSPLLFIVLVVAIFFGNQALAQTGTGGTSASAATVSLPNPLGSVTSPQALIGRVINSILGIVGSLALLMFVYGGLTWMTSSGSQDKVKKGKDTLVWAAIGLVVVFSAYALTRFLITAVTNK